MTLYLQYWVPLALYLGTVGIALTFVWRAVGTLARCAPSSHTRRERRHFQQWEQELKENTDA